MDQTHPVVVTSSEEALASLPTVSHSEPPPPPATTVISKKTYPLTLTVTGLTLTALVVGGAIGYSRYTTSAKQPLSLITPMPFSPTTSRAPSPTETPQGKSMRFVSLLSQEEEPENPFGEYKNPFSDEEDEAYVNPFSEETP